MYKIKSERKQDIFHVRYLNIFTISATSQLVGLKAGMPKFKKKKQHKNLQQSPYLCKTAMNLRFLGLR